MEHSQKISLNEALTCRGRCGDRLYMSFSHTQRRRGANDGDKSHMRYKGVSSRADVRQDVFSKMLERSA